MADIADLASDSAEFFFDLAQRHRQETAPVIIATGYCLDCDEALPAGQRWCGPECRDKWQRRAFKK